MAKTPQRAKADQAKRGASRQSASKSSANKSPASKSPASKSTTKSAGKSGKTTTRRATSRKGKGREPFSLATFRRRINGWLDHAGGRFGIGIGIGLLVGLLVVLGFNRFNHWVTQTSDEHPQATGNLTPAIDDAAKPIAQAPKPATTESPTVATATPPTTTQSPSVSEKTLDQLITDTQSEITEPDAAPVNPPAGSPPPGNVPEVNPSAVNPSTAAPVQFIVPAPINPVNGQVASAPVAPKPAPTIAAVPMTPTPRDGDQPAWLRNAVAFHAPITGPMIAIVLDDVGVNKTDAELAVDLPAPITLSMMTYADNVADLAARAHARGHELMLHVPMQPVNPKVDPGPNALLVGLDPSELKRRLDWGLNRFSGFIGINNHMGSRFTQDEPGMRVVMHELQSRGLLFLDSRTIAGSVGERVARETGVPHIGRDVFLDDDMSAEAVARQLAIAEHVATKQGYVIAIGHPHPTTVAVLKKWMAEARQRGFVLVPLSAVAKREIGVAG